MTNSEEFQREIRKTLFAYNKKLHTLSDKFVLNHKKRIEIRSQVKTAQIYYDMAEDFLYAFQHSNQYSDHELRHGIQKAIGDLDSALQDTSVLNIRETSEM